MNHYIVHLYLHNIVQQTILQLKKPKLLSLLKISNILKNKPTGHDL